MNRDDAITLAAKFKGLMPRMTDEQTRIIRDELLNVDDIAAAEKRIVGYCSTRSDFDVPSALNAVRNRVDLAQQTSKSLAEYRAYEAETAEQHRLEDELIHSLETHELQELANEAISTLPDRIGEIERRRMNHLQQVDPRPQPSRLVKGMIYRTLQAGKDERW